MKKIYLFISTVFVLLFLCSNDNKPIKIFMIGDSTMAIKSEKAFPENGWGMALSKLLKKNAIIENYARNGRSSKSFIREGRWDSVYSKISPGDYVIIQFGHNDEKEKDTARYTNPQTSFKENLRKFVKDTREKGGNPIICTPVVRRHFGKDGKLLQTHGDYPQAMRDVAVEMNVPLIDLQKRSEEKVNKLGAEKSKKLYMLLKPGEYPNFKDGKSDSTHLRVKGAEMVAKLFVQDVKKQKIPLAKLFK